MIRCQFHNCVKESTHRVYDQQYFCDKHGFPYTYRTVTLLLPKMTTDGLRILGVSRKDDPNDWGLPGGKVEATDLNDRDAIVRETYEECGVKIHTAIPVFTCLIGTAGKTNTTFTTTQFSGRIRNLEGEGRCGWIKPSLVLNGSFSYYNRRLFRSIGWELE